MLFKFCAESEKNTIYFMNLTQAGKYYNISRETLRFRVNGNKKNSFSHSRLRNITNNAKFKTCYIRSDVLKKVGGELIDNIMHVKNNVENGNI